MKGKIGYGVLSVLLVTMALMIVSLTGCPSSASNNSSSGPKATPTPDPLAVASGIGFAPQLVVNVRGGTMTFPVSGDVWCNSWNGGFWSVGSNSQNCTNGTNYFVLDVGTLHNDWGAISGGSDFMVSTNNDKMQMDLTTVSNIVFDIMAPAFYGSNLNFQLGNVKAGTTGVDVAFRLVDLGVAGGFVAAWTTVTVPVGLSNINHKIIAPFEITFDAAAAGYAANDSLIYIRNVNFIGFDGNPVAKTALLPWK